MQTTWKNITFTSKSTEIKAVELALSRGISIVVQRHYDYPDKWLFTCRNLGFALNPLVAASLEAAKKEAVLTVKAKLDNLTAKIAGLA